jgi:hypothetical protein
MRCVAACLSARGVETRAAQYANPGLLKVMNPPGGLRAFAMVEDDGHIELRCWPLPGSRFPRMSSR